MGVISFASLKGGVGKTSLSINVSHALAKRGCQTLLIDLDPAAHSSRLLLASTKVNESFWAPLARLFFAPKIEEAVEELSSVVEAAIAQRVPMIFPARTNFEFLPSGQELRHLTWGKGASTFSAMLPLLIEELNSSYDYIIIDTAPDFNVLTRTAISVSELVVVPVDASAMSITSLEEIVESSSHIERPRWSILRTMLTRKASRMHRLTETRLQEKLAPHCATVSEEDGDLDRAFENADKFLSIVSSVEGSKRNREKVSTKRSEDKPPIYLLDSLIHRTEQQNRLSFAAKTAFDGRQTRALASEYAAVARELEMLLVLCEELGDCASESSFTESGTNRRIAGRV